jgi:hypothetical protein
MVGHFEDLMDRGPRHLIIRIISFGNSRLFKPLPLSSTLDAVSGMNMASSGRDVVSSLPGAPI